MNLWSRRPALRWLVPAAAVAVALGGGAAANAIQSEDPHLPARSAAQLLVDLQTSQVGSFSGTVVTTADLGLPAVPETGQDGEDGAGDFGSLWSGSNTLRVWYDGLERNRIALLGTLNQSDIIRNGQDLWIWDSSENHASHWTLPEDFATKPSDQAMHHGMTPQQAAEAALAAIEPSTEVSTDSTTRVADRDAYELVLAPRDEASLINEVRIAIDAKESMPLQVQVYGDSADPAFEARFTQISFEQPDPEQFRFNPPPDGTVTEQDELWPSTPWLGEAMPEMTVVGDGWTSVVVARLPEDADQGAIDMLRQFQGQAFSGALFSAMVTEDGRVLLGAVTPERLAEVADDPAAALD